MTAGELVAFALGALSSAAIGVFVFRVAWRMHRVSRAARGSRRPLGS